MVIFEKGLFWVAQADLELTLFPSPLPDVGIADVGLHVLPSNYF